MENENIAISLLAGLVISVIVNFAYNKILKPVYENTLLAEEGEYGSNASAGGLIKMVAGTCIFTLLCVRFGMGLNFFRYSILAAILYSIAIIDAKSLIIPNRLVILGAVTGIVFRVAYCVVLNDMAVLISAFTGAVSGGLPLMLIIIASNGGMGAGDMKLMAMVGIWLGPFLCITALCAAYTLAAMVSIIRMALKRINGKTPVPMAPYMLASVIIVLFFNRQILLYFGSLGYL